MKNYIFILLFSSLGLTAQGQGTFAPLGAEWWLGGQSLSYTFWPGGFMGGNHKWTDHMKSVADTTIDNINCRKLLVNRYKRMEANPDSTFIDESTDYFVYDNVDTVFIYNNYAGGFTPLYVFNAQEQDTICIPLLAQSFGRDHFCYVIDSIRTELFDTTHLRAFYTRVIGADTQLQSFNWGRARPDFTHGEPFWVNNGRYVEKIGGFYESITSLLPYSSHNNQYGGMGINLPSGSIKCYSDSSTNIVWTSGNCDAVELTSLQNVEDYTLDLKLYPNPAKDKVMFSTNNIFNEATQITIFDISGRQVWSTMLASNNKIWAINLPDLNKGMYLLKAKNSKGLMQQKLLLE